MAVVVQGMEMLLLLALPPVQLVMVMARGWARATVPALVAQLVQAQL
jgi:hypothetical protein